MNSNTEVNNPDKGIRSYSKIADTYNEKRFRSKNGVFLYEADRSIIRRLVDRCAPKTILDAPTGTGRVLEYLDDFRGNVIGIDVTEEMLAIARKVKSDANIDIRIGNVSNLYLDSDSVDCVICLRFFHLFKPSGRRKFSEEFVRVLKPRGHLIVSFTNGWYGGGLYWIKRFLGGRTMYFQYPGEISTLFPEFDVVALEGNVLPKQHLFDRESFLGRLLTSITRSFPGNLICMERFYLLQLKEGVK